MFTLLRHQHPTVAHTLIHSVDLVFGPKSGFKINVGKSPHLFSGLKMRPVYNSGSSKTLRLSHCQRRCDFHFGFVSQFVGHRM